MHETANDDIHFIHCSINEPSKNTVIWQAYRVRQASLGAVGGWGGGSISAPLPVVLH